ncbi:MAG: hypothetical protein RJA10_2218 [Pseudomonadota bacterium]|jgi:hypothetical protein
MSVALQVVLLVVAIVVAIAGVGVALAVRMSSRQRSKVAARRAPGPAPLRPRKAAANVVPITAAGPVRAATTASTMAVPVTPQTPEQAHQAKLDALQSMLALGDQKAASAGKPFADTEAADDGYATTQFSDRTESGSSPLLNLDKLKPKRRSAQR